MVRLNSGIKWFQPAYVTADKGYDPREAFRYVGQDLGAVPVIDVPRRVGREAREVRECEAETVITPQGIRYRCERLPYDPFCSRFGKCPLLPAFVDGPLNDAPGPYYERYSPFPLRLAGVEGGLQHEGGCGAGILTAQGIQEAQCRTRGMAKVRLHVSLSLLAMNLGALVSSVAGSTPRRCVA